MPGWGMRSTETGEKSRARNGVSLSCVSCSWELSMTSSLCCILPLLEWWSTELAGLAELDACKGNTKYHYRARLGSRFCHSRPVQSPESRVGLHPAPSFTPLALGFSSEMVNSLGGRECSFVSPPPVPSMVLLNIGVE